MTYRVGADIGGTKIKVIVVDEDDQLCGQATNPTQTTNPNDLITSISETIEAALTNAKTDLTQVSAIGAGIPGQVNPDNGDVRLAVNLNLRAYPLGKALSAKLQKPVFLENDVAAGAIGAYHYVRQQEPLHHIAYLSIGTGIAAGIILDGNLYRGAHGMAGEVGHIVMVPNGDECGCGQFGCLETIASGPAIARRANDLMKVNGNGRRPTTPDVFTYAAKGNPVAQQIIQDASFYLSRVIQWLIMSYDVEKVVLGGGVFSAGRALLDPILAELAKARANSKLATTMFNEDKIILLPPDYNAGVWGAIQLANSAKLTANK